MARPAGKRAAKPKPRQPRASRTVAMRTPKVPRVPREPELGDVFDPRNPNPVPTIASEGLAFPVSDKAAFSTTLETGRRRLIIMSNVGSSATIGLSVGVWATPGIATLDAPMVAGTPATYMRSMKGSISIVNTTKRLDMGGNVYVGHFNQRLVTPNAPSLMTEAEWNTLLDGIVSNPDTVAYSGAAFEHEHRWVSHPSNQVNYIDYNPYISTLTADQYAQRVFTYGTSFQRPMSIIAIVFEDPPIKQTYSMAYEASWYARYPLTNLVSRAMTPVPTAGANVVNALRDMAEQHKDVARKGVRGFFERQVMPRVKTAFTSAALNAASRYAFQQAPKLMALGL